MLKTVKSVNVLPAVLAVIGLMCVALTFIYAHDRGIYESIKNDPHTISATANDGYYTVVDSHFCRIERYILFGFDINEHRNAA